MRRFILSAAVLIVVGATPGVCSPSDFPAKAISLVVPFPAGGRTDVVCRIVASGLSKELKKPVVVINRPGAGGVLGAREVADAAPDGYTLGCFSSASVSAQYTVPTPISLSEFKLIAVVNTDPAAVAVQYSAPYKSLKDLIEAARSNPGKLRLGTIPGASAQIFAAGLLLGGGVNMVEVPFKGDADGAIALAGNHIDAHVAVPVSYQALVAAKKVRILAVASNQRSSFYGMLPTFKENGIDLSISAFHGIFAPNRTPPIALSRVAEAIEAAMQSTEVRDTMNKVGAGWANINGEKADAFLQQQDVTYKNIITQLKLDEAHQVQK
ncbi:tripartite tricarboxylate transporter substrate binding protein [Bradyrhizobium sp. NP1]|uniref:tripartite tricarboxylate transporter substrate binding protein n=1 Tax=Bradyrhizobium sp. NP1 TaxID=3049772 RepID=UPI0025A5128C|nr:tripartite tricarboxylate transporter substrate binding protein [Bradyrhizobium sp. NP1]WJR76854.1 tripartite tricarboxylate transporter substrate binding protein [Bradyrhizobium sp. NP1]